MGKILDQVRGQARLGALDPPTPAPKHAQPHHPDRTGSDVPDDLLTAFSRTPPWLPCKYLYDDLGSHLYEEITELDEYYLFKEELRLLEAHADEIVAALPPGGVVVELGCGSARKTSVLLNAVARRHGTSACRYAGIDVSAEAVSMAGDMLLQAVPGLRKEQLQLVAKPYFEGLEAVRAANPPGTPLFMLWLGSSVGNFDDDDAADFLQRLFAAAGPCSQLLLCTDLFKDPAVLKAAYDDPRGVSEAFIGNGMAHALRALGHPYAALRQVARDARHVLGMGFGSAANNGDVSDGGGSSLGRSNGSGGSIDSMVSSGANGSSNGDVAAVAAGQKQHTSQRQQEEQRGGDEGDGDGDSSGGDPLWDYEAFINKERMQVEMWLTARRAVPGLLLLPRHDEAGEEDASGSVARRDLPKGGRVLVEISRKFTREGVRALALRAGLHVQSVWASPAYAMQLLLPALGALERCWADSDALFFGRVPEPDWGARPISLRHPLGFYPGHVASFAKAKIAPHLHGRHPLDIPLSRGIDPRVEDPSVCHAHPAPPPQWPTREETRAYVDEVRALLREALSPGGSGITHTRGGDSGGGREAVDQRMVAMALEHEFMHMETFCYLLAQLEKRRWQQQQRLVPPSAPRASGPTAAAAAAASEAVHVRGGAVTLGCGDARFCGFVWDNELGRSGPVQVGDLEVDAAPVTVAQFREFAVAGRGYCDAGLWAHASDLEHLAAAMAAATDPTTPQEVAAHAPPPSTLPPCRCPATWSCVETGGSDGIGGGGGGEDFWVHTHEGTRHWSEVADQPVLCSLAEAEAYCRWRGTGWRLVTEHEYAHAAASVPAVADGSAVVRQLAGGGWEWTSTLFAPLDPGAFEPDPAYPEYSADFFDGRHHVLRGWSDATPLAMRHRSPTFRNFYQRLYPFAFAKFRCCRSADG